MSKRDKRSAQNQWVIRAWRELVGMVEGEIREGRGPVLVVTGNPSDGTITVGWHPGYKEVEDKVLFLKDLMRLVRSEEFKPFGRDDNQEAP